jgi:TIR domain
MAEARGLRAASQMEMEARSRVFLSYAESDNAFADTLSKDLTKLGADVIADADGPRGEAFAEALDNSLESDAFVLVLSPAAVNSKEVRQEMSAAIARSDYSLMREPVLIVARKCAPSAVPGSWRGYTRSDATADYDAALADLASALELDGDAAPAAVPSKRLVQSKVSPATRSAPMVVDASAPSGGMFGGIGGTGTIGTIAAFFRVPGGMSRKIEFGAGIAAGVLGLATLVYLLFVPVPYCRVKLDKNGNCPSNQIANATLPQLHLSASDWVLFSVMVLLLFAGAVGAIAETRFDRPRLAPALWVGAVLSIAACALLGSLGPFYLGAVLAVSIAGYTSILPRIRGRRQGGSTQLSAQA